MKNKVLVVASVASMIDQFCMMNIEVLEDLGYEVHIAANFQSGSTSSNSRMEKFISELNEKKLRFFHVDFSRNPFKLVSFYKAYNQLKKIINNSNYDMLHCTSPIGGMISRLISMKKTKVIYSAHGFHFFKGASLLNWLLYYPIERCLANFTNCLITTNSEDYDLASKSFKTNVEFVRGVGINLRDYKVLDSIEKLALREEMGFNEKDFILIYPAELSKRKNQLFLLKAMTELKKIVPNIKLLLPGKGPMNKFINDKIDKLELGNNIKLLGFRTDLNRLYNIADVSVSSSKQEGLPVNVMMGMASGLPCVVTDCRGNRDLIKQGVNGFVVGLNDINSFITSIDNIFNSSELRANMTINNLGEIHKYSKKEIMKSMKNIYEKYI